MKKTKSSADVLLKQFQQQKAAATGSTKLTATGVYETWRVLVPKYCSEVKFVAPFTQVEMAMAKQLITTWGAPAQQVLAYVIKYWIGFTKYVQTHAGVYSTPLSPNVAFLAKHRGAAMNYFLADATNCPDAPTKPAPVVAPKKLDKPPQPATLPQASEDDAPMSLQDVLDYEAKHASK